MKEMPDEWISAYLDDEMSPMECFRGARKLCEDTEARQRLGRYQLIGDAIRYDLPEHLEPRFAAQMRQAIQAEVAESHTPPHWSLRGMIYWLLHPGPKVAFSGIAAAVLIAGLWGTTEMLEQTRPNTAYTTMIVEPQMAHTEAEIKRHHRTVQAYLAAHAEYVAPQAMLPSLQLVDYEE